MVKVNIFLGLVTHPGSRFAGGAGDSGLVKVLAGHLRAAGATVTVQINDTDEYEEAMLPLDRDQVVASITDTFQAEAQWREFLDESPPSLYLRTVLTALRLARTTRLAPPWRPNLSPESAGIRMLRRLLNIEFAHLTLMRQAINVNSEWALIVEDDASTEDVEAFADQLIRFTAEHAQQDQPTYVNVSESFNHVQLKCIHLLTRIDTWPLTTDSEGDVLSSRKPITNTVCAILYRTSFLLELVAEMDALPLSPVIPIDWKLNRALMNLFAKGTVAAGDCWLISPAPLVQRSMHAT